MSVTMCDVQHLCWKNFRKINDKLDVERGRAWTPFVMVTALLEEAGEVAAAVKGLEGFKPPEKPKTKEMLAAELSDLSLHSLRLGGALRNRVGRRVSADNERLHAAIHTVASVRTPLILKHESF